MSTQLSPQIRSQLQKLAEKDAFVESLDEFVKTAVSILCGAGEQHHQQTCPTALLLAFSHCYCHNQPISSLASQLPEGIRQPFIACCQKYEAQFPPLFKQENIEQLCDVEWSINISLGRQLWNIALIFESKRKFNMILNYQQLSVLVFKLGQVVSFVQNYQI